MFRPARISSPTTGVMERMDELNPPRLRVLLLEDVPMDAELLEYELGRAGIRFDARRVDTREGFLRELREFAPDLILSDYTLPKFDGMTALKLALELAPHVPFVVVTGSINEETAVGCMKAGAADYLLKNNLARIGPAIGAAIERARARADQHQAEAALRRSEANLRAIFNNTLQDFVLLDPRGVVRTLNKASSGWTHWVTGREVREGDVLAELLPEPIRAEWDGLFRRALGNEVITIEREVAPGGASPGEAAGGETRWFEASLIPVVDEGIVIGVCLSVVNITQRKRSEDHFRRAERMEAVGRLAGGVAHEVNNMMTVIQGFGDFLLRSLDERDDRRRDLREILKAADRAASVTRQLLAFSRQQVLQPRILSLNAVVGELEGMLRRILGESVRLELKLAPELGSVTADRAQLEQALVNLTLNARDALSDGVRNGRAGRLLVETAAVELDDGYLRRRNGVSIEPGRYAMLAVSDDGAGMAPEVLTRVFEPFYTTKPVGQGTGLGLSTVYGIVKQSGGYVWAYSEAGLGTTFKIYLPLTSGAAERTSEAHPQAGRQGGSETILVVEDEEIVRSLTCRILDELGYAVREAANGREAVAMLEASDAPVDLVLTDVVMPDMGGRELGERLRTRFPGLPVLYMSGYTGEDVVQRGLLTADAPFQQKPFTPDDLGRTIRAMLDARSVVGSGDGLVRA
jgi:PAS domain S-box-containing protein